MHTPDPLDHTLNRWDTARESRLLPPSIHYQNILWLDLSHHLYRVRRYNRLGVPIANKPNQFPLQISV